MEAFSLLKYWRGGGGGSGGGDSGTNLRSTATAAAAVAATTTIVTAVTQHAAETDDDDDDGGDDDGPFFDLEFAVQDEEEEEEDGDRMNNGEENGNVNVGVESKHNCTVLTEEEEEEDDGEEREFNFTISSNSSGGNDDRTDSNLTLSPSDDLFFKGRLVPIEPSSIDFNSAEPNSKPQFPVSLLKSATKFRVFMLGFKKSKQAAASEKPETNNSSSAAVTTTAADGVAAPKQQQQQQQPKPEAEKEKQNKFFTVKFKVEEVPIVSLFTRDNNGSRKAQSLSQKHQNNNNVVEDSVSVSVSSDEKRFSKDVMQKYLKKVKPLYVRVSKRYGEKLKFSGQLSLNSAARSVQSPPSTAGQKPKPTAELTCIAIDFIQPLLNVVEALLVRDIVNYYNAMCPTVVAASDCPKSFLTCSVPNLKLYSLSVLLHSANFKVNSNCAYVTVQIRIVSKSQEQTRFSNSRISNQQKLEQVVIFRIHDCKKVLLELQTDQTGPAGDWTGFL